MKKLLVLSQFYRPDIASTANLYTQLCEYLSKSFDVTVIAAVPSYLGKVPEAYQNQTFFDETENGVHIIRVRVSEFNKQSKKSRIKSLFGYLFRAVRAIRRIDSADIVLTLSQPPVLGGLLGYCASKRLKAKLVYNIQDFNPEQIIYTSFSKKRLIIWMLQKLDNAVCRRADAVILLSRDMDRTLSERLRHRGVPRSYIVSNWVDTGTVVPVEKTENPLIGKYGLDPKDFLVVYAGNVGVMQNLSTLILAADRLKDETGIRFVVIGEGAWSDAMKQMIAERGLENVSVYPYEPTENIRYVYSLGDVEIVSIGRNVTKCSMPSKTWNILACGRPVICQVDQDSELNRMIEEDEIGYAVAPGDDQAMAERILDLFREREKAASFSRNARRIAEERYEASMCMHGYEKALMEMTNR